MVSGKWPKIKTLPKEERQRKQPESAGHNSRAAKLIKLADKTGKLQPIGYSAAQDWSVERRLEYVQWVWDASPMTSAATPISAATEQEHHYNDDQDQFHGISPLLATALFDLPRLSVQRRLQSIVPDKRAPNLRRGCEQFSLGSSNRVIRRLGLNTSSMTSSEQPLQSLGPPVTLFVGTYSTRRSS
jgi:hypothetical protein